MNDMSEARARLRRAVLEAGRTERAPARLRASLVALATGHAVLTTASSSSASSGTAATAQASNVAPAISAASTMTTSVGSVATSVTLSKVVMVLALALAAAGAASAVVWTSSSSSAPRPTVTSEATATATTPAVRPGPSAVIPAPSSASVPDEGTSVSIDELPSVPSAARPKPRVVASSSRASPSPAPEATNTMARLADETRRLGEIRATAAAGDAREALRLLDGYETEFPSGVLIEEAEVLRIECLERTGSTAEAGERARRFLIGRPASPHAARVRAMAARQPSPHL
jgi:hypothetical protein